MFVSLKYYVPTYWSWDRDKANRKLGVIPRENECQSCVKSNETCNSKNGASQDSVRPNPHSFGLGPILKPTV